MINLQQRLETLTEKTANLVAQVDELNKLRDKIRRAQLSTRRRPGSQGTGKSSHLECRP
jgi:hypothetical protein